MSGRIPTTRSQAVSDSHLPTLTQGRRVRSLGAALAGGSPLSSSSPSGSDRSQSPVREFQSLITSPLQQAASSQGATSSGPPVAPSGACLALLPLGGFLEEVEMGTNPALPPDEDVVMESATTRELAKALRDIAAHLPIPQGGAEWVIDEAKAKINAATSDTGLTFALPHQFQSDVCEYLKTYRIEVEALASARSMLSKLRKHKHAKSYPMALNSIKSPSIQFTRAFVNSLTTEGHCGAYNIASGTGTSAFEQAVDQAVKALKDEVLKCWTSEKDREVTYLESKASVATATANLEGVVHTKHAQLKARYDYLIGTPSYDGVLRDVDAFAAISHTLTPFRAPLSLRLIP